MGKVLPRPGPVILLHELCRVVAGHGIESEAGLWKDGNPASLSMSETAVTDLAHWDWSVSVSVCLYDESGIEWTRSK